MEEAAMVNHNSLIYATLVLSTYIISSDGNVATGT